MKMLLHASASNAGNIIEGLFGSVLFDALIETVLITPFIFIAYLILEFIEHKASERTLSFLERSGKAGPAVGALLGAAPQCAFSAVAANLYTGRVISLGTLIAVFLSTSDEMLIIMISEGTDASAILLCLAYKLVVGIAVGFTVDAVYRLIHGKEHDHIHVEDMCEESGCHCERGIIRSAIYHTVTITLLIFAVTLAVGVAVYFIGEDILANVISSVPGISHLVSALIGLVPGCATSVALTSLYTDGIISAGVMLSGLFSGAGVGMLVLLKVNKRWRENLIIMGTVTAVGFVFGLIFDLSGLSTLI